jgi:uncharacterized membrane protein
MKHIFPPIRNNFSVDKVNTGRQREVDLARGFAVLFMIWVHVLEVFAEYLVQDSAFGVVIEFLGGPPAAPVFMLLMGISIAYSRQNTPKNLIWRGFKILLLGYALNILREIVPLYIGLEGGLLSKYDLLPYTWLTLLLQVDILQFAGIALIFIGVLQALNINRWLYLPIALIFAILNPFVWEIQSGIHWLDLFLDLLWGVDYYIFFPFMTWIIYPLVGVVIGDLLIRAKDKRIFYRYMLALGLSLLVLGTVIVITDPDFHLGDYYRHAIGSQLWMTGFVLTWWSALFFLTARFSNPKMIIMRMTFWSKHVTSLYFIHWVIIGWSVLLLGYESISLPGILLLMALFTVLSDRLTYMWVKIKS